jgi:hypothetical protein
MRYFFVLSQVSEMLGIRDATQLDPVGRGANPPLPRPPTRRRRQQVRQRQSRARGGRRRKSGARHRQQRPAATTTSRPYVSYTRWCAVRKRFGAARPGPAAHPAVRRGDAALLCGAARRPGAGPAGESRSEHAARRSAHAQRRREAEYNHRHENQGLLYALSGVLA